MRRAVILENNKKSAIYNILSNSVHSLYIRLGSASLNNSIIYNCIGAVTLFMLGNEVSIIYTAKAPLRIILI